MPAAGVLFDFSGTLFHIETAEAALRAALGPDFVHRAADLVRFGAINGSSPPADLPATLAEAWATRDLSAAAHRAAYSGSARHAGLSEEQAARLYERGIAADAWQPFPDTVGVLQTLHAAGVPIAVVSNIGWDPRPVLRRYAVDDCVDVLVLSDERGVLKPDPEIFLAACADLGVAPAECVMVGDNPDADGGSTALGIRFVLVSADPAQRGTTDLMRAVGLA